MVIGKFDKVVALQKNTPTGQGAGLVDSYSTYVTTRGYLKKKSGNRGVSFGEILGNDSYTLFVRYQTAIATYLRTDNKVIIDSKTFTVDSFELVDEEKKYYKINLNIA